MKAKYWMTGDELRLEIEAKSREVGGQRELARVLGLSEQYLCDVLRGRREPGSKMQRGLGVKRVVVYESL